MPDVVIENPIINAPYTEPDRHFRFDSGGITNEVVSGRRRSEYFIPIPAPRKRFLGEQLPLAEWTADRLQPNDLVNELRVRLDVWRKRGRPGTTAVTRRLLEYWTAPDRDRPLFFCQVEALEAVVYLTECAAKQGDGWALDRVRQANAGANPELFRTAMKMATGTGKTVVMAMLIAWHTLNKVADPRARAFSDCFLVVAPGITIRDRLRVLLPADPGNYYAERDLVPPEMRPDLGAARVVITNFHGFALRETQKTTALGRAVLTGGTASPFTETPDQMVARVCRDFGARRGIVVLNDEAHHCYRRKVDDAEDDVAGLTRAEKAELAEQEDEARVWISGVEAIAAKKGLRAVYDLSATPFFLAGSGYREGTLFPWVVSDFSLIDAIEAGLVKIPRVPVADDAMTGPTPTYRDLWLRIRDDLPKRGRADVVRSGPPELPDELAGALHSLYGDYERSYRRWAESEAASTGGTPPVFIVVCNNTAVSKLVFDWVAGWDRAQPDGTTVAQQGRLDLFRNEDDGRWADRPRTILVDSKQLESGAAMSAEFKRVTAREITEFHNDLRTRFPGRSVEDITDEDLLREVMNTVGKPGRLGADVRCVVSVSMLTEGWDANTVTHILGVRAFGTQLLCEQVVGRGLRRVSYALGEDGCFSPEYAEVYGVPFTFLPTAPVTTKPPLVTRVTHVRALPERHHLAITFPRVVGYRVDATDGPLWADFSEVADDPGHPWRLQLRTDDLPTRTEMVGIVGQPGEHTLDRLRAKRPQEVAFALAREVMERHFRDDAGNVRTWYFSQLAVIARQWLDTCVHFADGTFPGMLLLPERGRQAVERVRQAVTSAPGTGASSLVAVLDPTSPNGTTGLVAFDTTKATYVPKADRSPISHIVLDGKRGNDWEAKVAGVLEELPGVRSFVKNDHVGFAIPYIDGGGATRNYLPDYVVSLEVGDGEEPATLIVEVSGSGPGAVEKREKLRAARELWLPAVAAHGGSGRWGLVNVTDPWDCRGDLEVAVATLRRA